MPGHFIPPHTRRTFLRTALLGGAGLLCSVRGATAAPATSEFHVALLSDTHIPGDRQNGYRGFLPNNNLRQIVPQVVRSSPETVIINGDAARLEGLAPDYAELRLLLEPIAAEAPIVIGLGNHDDRANFSAAFPEPAGTQADVAGKHITILEHPNIRILVLDSLLYVNKTAGLLGRSQRLWLQDNLPQLNDRPAAIFVHHTLNDGDGDLLDVDRLFAILKANPHVKAIFYGHSHVWSIDERAGVRLINLPAVGYNFRDEDPVGWVDARFRPDGVDLTLHAIAGNRTDDGRTTTVDWL